MYYCVILSTLLTITSISGFNLGDLKNYRIYSFDTNGKVCSPSGVKGKLEITESNYSAILITSTKLNEQRRINFDCKFTVDASPFSVLSSIKKIWSKDEQNSGLFAVVQYMDLRYDEYNKECIDYVQFKVRGKPYGPQLCGHHNIGISMNKLGLIDEVSNLTYISESGAIDTHIFIHRRPLEYDQRLDLKIVFTAYRKCKNDFSSKDFCGPQHLQKCISHEYFHDGLVNCPYSSCSDEVCIMVAQHLENIVNSEKPIGMDYDGVSTDAKVTIGAVTTLLVSFLAFIVCIWCCKKWGKLCWAEECANSTHDRRSTVRSSQPSRTIELENRSEPSVPTISPTAPSVDKDLPPSYDSLFPTH